MKTYRTIAGVTTISTFLFTCVLTFSMATRAQNSASTKRFESTLCEVYDNPQKFVGRDLLLSGIIILDINTPLIIWGSDCQNKIFVGTYSRDDQEEYKRMLQKLEMLDDLGVKRVIEFEGILEENPIKGHTAIRNVLQDYTLTIKKLLKVSRKVDAKPSTSRRHSLKCSKTGSGTAIASEN